MLAGFRFVRCSGVALPGDVSDGGVATTSLLSFVSPFFTFLFVFPSSSSCGFYRLAIPGVNSPFAVHNLLFLLCYRRLFDLPRLLFSVSFMSLSTIPFTPRLRTRANRFDT